MFDSCSLSHSGANLLLTFPRSGSGPGYDGTSGPAGPPGPPGTISVNDIINLLQRESDAGVTVSRFLSELNI